MPRHLREQEFHRYGTVSGFGCCGNDKLYTPLCTKADISRPAPDLGQDNAAIYGELPGLTKADHTTESHLIFGDVFSQFNLRLTLSRRMWYNDPTDTEEGWA